MKNVFFCLVMYLLGVSCLLSFALAGYWWPFLTRIYMSRLVLNTYFQRVPFSKLQFRTSLDKRKKKGKLDVLEKSLVDFLSVWLRQVLGHPVIIWHWNQLTHSHSNLMWETWSISDPLLPRHHIYKYIILIIWVALVALIGSDWLLKTIPDLNIHV